MNYTREERPYNGYTASEIFCFGFLCGALLMVGCLWLYVNGYISGC